MKNNKSSSALPEVQNRLSQSNDTSPAFNEYQRRKTGSTSEHQKRDKVNTIILEHSDDENSDEQNEDNFQVNLKMSPQRSKTTQKRKIHLNLTKE